MLGYLVFVDENGQVDSLPASQVAVIVDRRMSALSSRIDGSFSTSSTEAFACDMVRFPAIAIRGPFGTFGTRTSGGSVPLTFPAARSEARCRNRR